jgi:thiol-disulfide isomerase/thioredoxin
MKSLNAARAIVLICGVAGSLAMPVLGHDEPTMPAEKTEKAGPSLVAGMPAPKFKVERFVKGTEFSTFDKGKVYVVEFWATWCGPCIMSMPHLTELQKEYASKGVTICGVNVREEKNYSATTYDKVDSFVKKRGDRMGYTVAYDGEAKFMETNWMQPAQARGIPTAFVVDGTGTIAWIGHPAYLDMVLDEVTKGSWDIKAGDAKLKGASNAFDEAGKQYVTSLESGNEAWANAEKLYPVLAPRMTVDRVNAMIEANRIPEAAEKGRTVVDNAIAKKSHSEVLELLSALGDPDTMKHKELRPLLLKAAEANLALGDASEAGPHVAMARALWYNGQNDKARAEADLAIKLAGSDDERVKRLEQYLKDCEEAAKD